MSRPNQNEIAVSSTNGGLYMRTVVTKLFGTAAPLRSASVPQISFLGRACGPPQEMGYKRETQYIVYKIENENEITTYSGEGYRAISIVYHIW